MRKVVLMVLLAAASSNAAAKWTYSGRSDRATSYTDLATIRKSGNMVKMWGLIDFKTGQDNGREKPYLSLKLQSEYDCKEERERLLYASFHSEKMGQGEIVSVNRNPSEWSPIVPNSLVAGDWEIACGKK